MLKKIGPGVLIAAAFVGPGTVTACMLAGANYGYAFLWALLLSVFATAVLQEMSARMGIVTKKGLALVIREELPVAWVRNLVIGIILGAIVIGNASYEAGNIGGGVLGLEAIFGSTYLRFFPFLIGLLVFFILYLGSYKAIEKVFVLLVLVMSLSFVVTAIITKPDLVSLFKGLLVPSVPNNSILTIIALVGTTVVPYNLFLHASLVNEKWKSKADLKAVRKDTYVSIFMGGFVSICIVVVAATANNNKIDGIMDMAIGLEPLYGKAAKYFMGIGLFAAGITSSITAPLAAAYVANNCFGWKAGFKDLKFRIVWIVILLLGVFFLSFGIKPIKVITFAQVANGILLPVIAIFLLWAVNRSSLMGEYKNSKSLNVIGVIIILLSIFLGAKSIFKVFGLF